MKNFYFLLLVSFSFLTGKAQVVDILGNAGTSGNIVIGGSNYHVSESIYTEAEIGAGNFTTAGTAINQLNFFIQTPGPTTNVTNFRIWMKNVPAATTTLATGAYTSAGYTQVYNGAFTAAAGVSGVTLTTPFARTAGSNLQVLIERLNNVIYPGNVVIAAAGNNTGSAVLSSRRFNGTTLPVDGVTSLAATNFRPAIQLVHFFPIDAAITGLNDPRISCYNAPQTITVELSNTGTSNIAAGAAAVTLKIGGPNTFTGTIANTGVITPGAAETITFTGVNLNNPGENEDTAYVNLAGDGTTLNDTLITSTITATTLGNPPSAFPITEDAEGAFAVVPYIELVFGTEQLWTLNTGNYQNGDMPDPLVPRAPGTTFFLFDSYQGGGSIDFISRLFSNCIKLPSQLVPNPPPVITVSFWMSRDSLFVTDGFVDSLYLSISTDKGLTWTRLQGYQRNDPAATLPYWQQKIVDISAYRGQTIQLGFEGASDWGNAIGLDDIVIGYTGVIPVTVLNFDAKRTGNVNKLTWATSQEQNSNSFIIERSRDGVNFSPIGTVQAAGNSNTTRNYSFIDPLPVKGINHYRLRITDRDNSFRLSVVRNVRNIDGPGMVIAPNPVEQAMKLAITVDQQEKAQVIITDLSGRNVHSSYINLATGTTNVDIPVNALSKGSYIVRVKLANQTLNSKINKL